MGARRRTNLQKSACLFSCPTFHLSDEGRCVMDLLRLWCRVYPWQKVRHVQLCHFFFDTRIHPYFRATGHIIFGFSFCTVTPQKSVARSLDHRLDMLHFQKDSMVREFLASFLPFPSYLAHLELKK